MAHDDNSGVVGGGGSRRGAGSGSGFTGGGSDTDAGSGVTGDDGDDTSFSGGGGSDDSDAGGDAGDGGGGDVADDTGSSDSSGVVGGGGSRAGDDSDTTFDGGGSDTDAGSGVTGDDGTDTTFEGGQSEQNRTQAPSGETGAEDQASETDTDGSADRGVSFTRGPGGEEQVTSAPDRDGATPRVEQGETTERGVGITRGPEGTEIVRPAADEAGALTAAEARRVSQQQLDAQRVRSEGETRAAINRFGQRQLAAVRRQEGGQTALDREIEGFEAATGVDIPGDGDFVQQTETFLSDAASDIRSGATFLPTPDEAERFGADAAATTVSGDGREVRVFDTTFDREEAAREFGGQFSRLSVESANVPAAILGAGRTAEAAGETGFNLAAGFAGRGLEEENIGPLDPASQNRLAEAALAAGARGREQTTDATRTVVQGTEVAARRARNNPAEALGAGAFIGGSALVGTAAGTAATRGLSALPDRVRSVRARRAADETVEFEDVASARGAEGELPEFETDPSAPTGEAVDEVRQRAADNPDAVLEAVDEDRALFQSTEAELGPGFEARRGSSELPGLFTSPDASPLRLDVGESQSAPLLSTDVRLPRLRDFTSRDDRLAAFPGDRVEGFPDDATGSGRVPDGDGGFEPDPETSGAQFLDEEAAEGTAFVRPQGGRTTELEALFPPGSEFGQSGRLAVELPGGRTVPIDVFRRADDLPDADGGGPLGRFLGDERGRATLGDERPGGTRTIREIDDELRRLRRRDRDAPRGDPVTPAGASGATSPSSTPSASSGVPSLSEVSSPFGSGSGAESTTGGPFESADEFFGSSGSGFASSGGGFGSSSGSGAPSPSQSPFSLPSSDGPSAPSSPSGPSASSPSSPSSPSTPTTPSSPVLPGSPGLPSTPERRRDDSRNDDDDEEFDDPFAAATEDFTNPVATAEDFFGGGEL